MKTKAHTIYKNKEGQRVCGTTTVTGILNKPLLVAWANNLGLKGIEVGKYVDDLANVGKLAHEMIHCHLTGKELDTSDYSKKDIDRAENAVISYFNWEKGKNIKIILAEIPLVNERKQYGGTPDLYAEVDGVKTLLDFKTSKSIWPEHLIQVVGGYKPMLEELGHKVDQVIVLRVGRTENEGFETRTITDNKVYEQIFDHCLAIYQLNKLIK